MNTEPSLGRGARGGSGGSRGGIFPGMGKAGRAGMFREGFRSAWATSEHRSPWTQFPPVSNRPTGVNAGNGERTKGSVFSVLRVTMPRNRVLSERFHLVAPLSHLSAGSVKSAGKNPPRSEKPAAGRSTTWSGVGDPGYTKPCLSVAIRGCSLERLP